MQSIEDIARKLKTVTSHAELDGFEQQLARDGDDRTEVIRLCKARRAAITGTGR